MINPNYYPWGYDSDNGELLSGTGFALQWGAWGRG